MGRGYFVSGPVLFFLISFLALSFSIGFAAAEITIYEEHAFYLEYPEEWEIVDSWSARPSEVFFKTDFRGDTGVSIFYQKSLIELSNIDDALVDTLVENEKAGCRLNRDGDCWSFELLDAKIITIGGQKAVSIKYSSFLMDKDTITRMVLLPDGQNNWLVLGKAVGNGLEWEDDIEKSVSSFQLASSLVTIEQEDEPQFFAPSDIAPYDPDIILEKNLDVNLIIIGDTWTTSQKKSITNELPGYFDPIYVTNEEKVGIRYNYQYYFYSEGSSELSKFMDKISYPNAIWGSDITSIPIWQAYWIAVNHPEWIDIDSYGNVLGYNIEYRDVDALAMEEYLYEHFIGSNPDLTKSNSVNLIFLNTDLGDINYLHNYFLSDFDKSTDEKHNFYGLMGYGGNYNMYFFDLYAVPWIDIDRDTFEYTFPSWIESLHDCILERCFRDLVAFHTKSALSQIITPSFLYPIDYYEKYILDVVIYLKPGGRVSLTTQTLDEFVDKENVLEELKFLYPFAEWDVNYSIERKDTRGLTLDFKKQLALTDHIVYENEFGDEKAANFLRSDDIQPYLLEWADQWLAERAIVESDTVWEIPILIVIDGSPNELYIDNGALGLAPGIISDDSIPCCAFGVTDNKKVWYDGIGFTDLLLHEVGHVLGLNHPFLYWDEYGDAYQNDYFNWYASPMTYSSPPSRCGNFYYFIYIDSCGNPSLSFTEFEQERISDARLVSLLKKTSNNLKSIPEGQMPEIQDIINAAKQKYKTGDIFSLKGALPLAIDAYSTSQNLIDSPSVDTPVSPFLASEKPRVPEWVQTTAKFWVDGKVSDMEFTSGLGYLVKQNIIQVDVEPESGEEVLSGEESEVPAWIAQTTEWWINGEVPEDQFLEGIKWMIKNKIIRVQ